MIVVGGWRRLPYAKCPILRYTPLVGIYMYGEPCGVDDPKRLELRDWRAEFVIHPNGDAVSLARLVAAADTRTLSDFYCPGWEADGTPENFCNLVALSDLWPSAQQCEACPDGVVTCLPIVLSVGDPELMTDGLIDVSDGQRENHLCEESCSNETDDDADGDADLDPECDRSNWPYSLAHPVTASANLTR
ncbi:MAG: hypothetical protein ACJAYU_000445 [Bradymonadia bacterium]|jgi:hypothetical protein